MKLFLQSSFSFSFSPLFYTLLIYFILSLFRQALQSFSPLLLMYRVSVLHALKTRRILLAFIHCTRGESYQVGYIKGFINCLNTQVYLSNSKEGIQSVRVSSAGYSTVALPVHISSPHLWFFLAVPTQFTFSCSCSATQLDRRNGQGQGHGHGDGDKGHARELSEATLRQAGQPAPCSPSQLSAVRCTVRTSRFAREDQIE